MNKQSKIYVAGHRGLVGSAVVRKLTSAGYSNIVVRTHAELDLTRQSAVDSFFAREKPDAVILAAAKVGGIGANSTYPAEFIYQNLAIAVNIIEASRKYSVEKLINLGSSCIYPKFAPQPLKEEYLLTGPLEPTNEAYAIAKIAAIKLCKFYNQEYGSNFVSLMPTNLYGPNDNYDLNSSHVLPAMIRKFHEGKLSGGPVILWGDGSPLREFLYVDDLADAIMFVLEDLDAQDIGELINIGTGKEITIKDLATLIARIVGYDGEMVWDTSKPNGTLRKVLDIRRINSLGWHSILPLRIGIEETYKDFIQNID